MTKIRHKSSINWFATPQNTQNKVNSTAAKQDVKTIHYIMFECSLLTMLQNVYFIIGTNGTLEVINI